LHMRVPNRAEGGKARAAALSPEKRREIARKAGRARHKLLPKATHTGTLEIADLKIPCYVLEDGTRILSQRGLNEAFGIVHGGGDPDGGLRVPRFIRLDALKPYISNELTAGLARPVEFAPPHGGRSVLGIPAVSLPDVCNAWLNAREQKALTTERQLSTAQRAEILMRGLAHVGIIALVDEATGYQRDRAKDALARILEAFVAKELQPYISTFPADYYEQIFRLRGVDYPNGSVKRPQYFGTLTNDIIYKRLAPGVLDELKRLKQEVGRDRDKLFQRLTTNLGYPKLREHLGAVIAVMKLSAEWHDFMTKLDRLYPRFDRPTQLVFDYLCDDDDGKGI
jgi:hypothetical protein